MSNRILSVLTVSCIACVFAHATDRITLNDSTTLEGQVVRDTPGDSLVTINTGGKLVLLNRREIASIALDDEGRAEYARRRDAIKDNQAAAHFELYKWAAAQRLFDYAERELAATLKADSSHAEARKIAFAPAVPDAPKKTLAAQLAAAPALADAGPVIGLRVNPPLRARAEYDEKIVTFCRALLPAFAADESARRHALTELAKDRIKATEAVVGFLDPARDADEQTRLAALAGLDALKPASPDISKRLAQMAISDPFIPVRKQTVALIKARNDEGAMSAMVNSFIGAFGENGQVRDPIMQAAAGNALKGLDDNRIHEAVLHRATMEVRTAVSELNNLATRQIDSYTVNTGAARNVIVPLSFPIQFPELKITQVKTTVCAPCAALSSLTGQDFGNDLEAWAKWIRMHK